MQKPKLFDRISVIAIAASVLLFLSVYQGYSGTTTPMTQSEIDGYIKIVAQSLEGKELKDGLGSYEPEKFLADARKFAESDDGKPFYMANIMKLRDNPSIPEWMAFEGTAQEADLIYDKEVLSELLKVGAHPAYFSTALPNAMNYGATEDNDQWSQIALVRYPSREAFFKMITSDSYLEIGTYKFISMGTVLLTPTQTALLPINPLPDFTVLLFFVLVIFNLALLLVRTRKHSQALAHVQNATGSNNLGTTQEV